MSEEYTFIRFEPGARPLIQRLYGGLAVAVELIEMPTLTDAAKTVYLGMLLKVAREGRYQIPWSFREKGIGVPRGTMVRAIKLLIRENLIVRVEDGRELMTANHRYRQRVGPKQCPTFYVVKLMEVPGLHIHPAIGEVDRRVITQAHLESFLEGAHKPPVWVRPSAVLAGQLELSHTEEAPPGWDEQTFDGV